MRVVCVRSGADVTGNDGVYSGFWSVGPQGIYTLAVRVTPTNTSSTVGNTPSDTDTGTWVWVMVHNIVCLEVQ